MCVHFPGQWDVAHHLSPRRTPTFDLCLPRTGHGGLGTMLPCTLPHSQRRSSLLTIHNSQFTSWIADSYNLNTWMIVSSMVGLGLSWWQAWICVWLGYGCISPFIVLNARPGAMHHITFPVVARTSFGIWGSLWCTLNRGVMACVWYGVQVSYMIFRRPPYRNSEPNWTH